MTGLLRKIVAALAMLIGILLRCEILCAQSFIFPGVQPATEAGFSQTNTRGATAVMTNPANIVVMPLPRNKVTKKDKVLTHGIETYADLSFLSVNYTYKRQGHDPTVVTVAAPPVTFGASWRPSPLFALGVEAMPRPALSAQQIKNLTVEQDGQILTVNATSKQGSMLTGAGASIKPSKFVSFGLSVLETAEDNSFSATDVASTDNAPLVQMTYKGSFLQFLGGARFTSNNQGVVGVSYKTAVVKKYTGAISLSGAPADMGTKQGYLPSVFAIGGEYRFGAPLIFGELRHESWSAGASSVRSGLPSSPTTTELKDTNIFIVGGRQRWKGGHAVSFAYGKYPANVGYGTGLDEDGKSSSDSAGGIEFGEFDAIERDVFAGGYQFTGSRGYLQAGVNYQTGSRTVPLGYRNSGQYSLSVFTLTGGIAGHF